MSHRLCHKFCYPYIAINTDTQAETSLGDKNNHFWQRGGIPLIIPLLRIANTWKRPTAMGEPQGFIRTYTTEHAIEPHSLHPMAGKELRVPSSSEGGNFRAQAKRVIVARNAPRRGVGGPMLSEDCQEQHPKRKFLSLLLPRLAASLFLPPFGSPKTVERRRIRYRTPVPRASPIDPWPPAYRGCQRLR